MPQLSTSELALLHLDTVASRDGPVVAYDRSVPGIIEALSVSDTVAGRVELLTSLQTVTDDGLVETTTESVAGLNGERALYHLTDAGEAAVDELLVRIGDDTVVVKRDGDRETITVRDLETAVPDVPFVQALAAVTAEGVLRITDGDGFIDRNDELATFDAELNALDAGTGSTVLVTGEHGMGKTTLVETVLRRAENRGFKTATGAARETMSEPYAPFRSALDDYRDDAPSQLFEASERLEGANLEERRQSFFYDVADYLSTLSEAAPLVLFVNDLERADPATIALFEYLHDALADAPVLLVGSVTTDTPAANRPFADAESELANATRITLEGFDRDGTVRFLEQELDDTAIPAAFVDALHELTGGNPLFLEASVSYMADEGTIDPRNSYYPTDTEALPVPDQIQSVILERIGGLDAGTADILERGSVVGETIHPEVLAAVVDADTETVMDHAQRLVDAGVWSREENGRLRFTSNVVRDVVHDSLDAAKRSRIHEQVADALQEAYGVEGDAHAAEVANHYRAGSAVDLAIEWYERAGSHAAGVYAYETAVEAYERALELARERDSEDDILRVMAALGRVHLGSDDYDEAERYFEYVSERTQDSERLRSIVADRAKIGIDRGDYTSVVETVDRALEDWDGETRSTAIAKLLIRKAWALSLMRESAEANELGERAQVMASELDSDELLALVLKVRGVMAHHDRDFERAVEFGTRAADAATDAGAERLLAGIYNNLAGCRAQMGDYRGSMEAFERSQQRWQAIGNRVGEAVPLGNLGFTQMKLGRLDEAESSFERSAELGKRFGLDGHLVHQYSFLGQLHINKGDLATARESLERCWELAAEINHEQSVYGARAHLSRVCRLEDTHEEALEHVAYVVEETDSEMIEEISDAQFHYGQIKRENGNVDEALRVHQAALDHDGSHWKRPVIHRIGLAMAKKERGELDEALELTVEAADSADEVGDVPTHLGARTAIGQIQQARGELDAAEATLRAVIEESTAIGSRTYECQAQLVLGTVLAEQGREDEARPLLETARETATNVGATLFVRKATEAIAELD